MASSAELLVTVGRGRLGALDVVRVTAGGSTSRRESLFRPPRALVARMFRQAQPPGSGTGRTSGNPVGSTNVPRWVR